MDPRRSGLLIMVSGALIALGSALRFLDGFLSDSSVASLVGPALIGLGALATAVSGYLRWKAPATDE